MRHISQECIDLDYIIHLAAVVGVERTLNDPLKVLEDIKGFYNVCNLALFFNARKVLFSSSSEVYGEPVSHPQNELDTPLNAKLPYAVTKLVGEKIFESFKSMHGLEFSIMRFFNTYGPKMNPHDGRVVSNFIVQALTNKPITIYGDGSQTRSFCYVDDLINGLISLMNSSENGPINIGNPNEFSIKELAEIEMKKVNSNSEVIFMPLPQDDPLQRKPVIDKAKNKLNWFPRVELEEGLLKTINYFQKII